MVSDGTPQPPGQLRHEAAEEGGPSAGRGAAKAERMVIIVNIQECNFTSLVKTVFPKFHTLSRTGIKRLKGK